MLVHTRSKSKRQKKKATLTEPTLEEGTEEDEDDDGDSSTGRTSTTSTIAALETLEKVIKDGVDANESFDGDEDEEAAVHEAQHRLQDLAASLQDNDGTASELSSTPLNSHDAEENGETSNHHTGTASSTERTGLLTDNGNTADDREDEEPISKNQEILKPSIFTSWGK